MGFNFVVFLHIFLYVNLIFISIVQAQPTSESTVYEYDDLGRLKRVVYPAADLEIDYVFDPAGNRKTVTTLSPIPPSFSIADASVSEGDNLQFVVTKSTIAGQNYSVSYSTSNGSATANADYVAIGTTVLTFAPHELQKTISVTSVEDTTHELSETMSLMLSSPTGGASITDNIAIGAINDDDGAPSFSVNNVSATEGGNLTFTITKTGSSAVSHNVSYATANSTAASADYTAASGQVSFSSSQSARTVSIATTNDVVFEVAETFLLNLSSPTGGASISDSQGIGTINDNDPTNFSVSDVSAEEGDSLTYTVSLNTPSSKTHAITFFSGVSGSTATAVIDFTPKTQVLSFSPGQLSKTISIFTIEDTEYEVDETVNVIIHTPTNGAGVGDANGTGIILNDDSPGNSPPVVQNESISLDLWDSSAVFPLANDTDPDGNTLSISAWTQSSSNIFVEYNATLKKFTITALAIGTNTVTYTVSDGQGAFATGTVTVAVSDPCGGNPFC